MLVYYDFVYMTLYALQKRDQMANKMVDYKYSPYESYEKHGGYSSDLADTLRRLKEEIRIYKEDNDKIIQAQEKQAEVNDILLQSFSELQ